MKGAARIFALRVNKLGISQLVIVTCGLTNSPFWTIVTYSNLHVDKPYIMLSPIDDLVNGIVSWNGTVGRRKRKMSGL
jgi:hypothetical protein